jgi:hypothetical protein
MHVKMKVMRVSRFMASKDKYSLKFLNKARYYMPVIPTLKRLMQVDCESEVSLGYISSFRPSTTM